MSIEDVLTVLIGTAIVSGIVAAANYADRDRNNRLQAFAIGSMLVLGVLLILLMGLQVLAAYASSDSSALINGTNAPEKANAWGAFLISLITMGLVTAVALRPVRETIAAIFPQRDRIKSSVEPAVEPEDRGTGEREEVAESESEPLYPQMLNYYTTDSVILPRPANSSVPAPTSKLNQKAKRGSAASGGYNPYSVVHTVALMLSLYFLSTQFIGFVLSGGLKGVAESYSSGLSAWDILLNGLPEIIIPIIGVGFGIRRNLSQTLKRLGFEIPTAEQLGIGFGVVILLFIFIATVSFVWQGVVSQETFNEQNQASEALSESINTLWMAFFIAAMAGVGEEIAFRGALQPVFGLWPTSILFALFHMQYTLTPATLIILGVALAFGWLRKRYNTTLAILAHFLYDFVQLALVVSMPDNAGSWIMHLL